jgi:ABC-type antimicrobial peptide transport system permease subunit
VLAAFATMAVLLVAVGLYGTLAYLVAQRTPELGVRLALGASTRQMVALVAKEGALLALAGTVIGAFGALGISRALRTALYDVAPGDPVTLAGIVVAVVVIAVVATSRPAWQAAHVDPNVALKNE